MDEIEELILANSPTMQIIKKEKSSQNSIGSMTFKCGKKLDKYRILPFARNMLKKVQCKCDPQTNKKFRTGTCNMEREGRKFDIGDNFDFSNWYCDTLDYTPTGNQKIPAGLKCNKDDRVFGGAEANASSHPWLVHISGRVAKVNENGEVNYHSTWKRGCQGVLVDSKTVVTTADCAVNDFNSQHTETTASIGWQSYSNKEFRDDTSLGSSAHYSTLREAIQVCKTLPEDDCVGITYDREPTAFGLRRYQLRYGTELSLLDESRPDVDKFFVKTWVRPPTHTDSFDQEWTKLNDSTCPGGLIKVISTTSSIDECIEQCALLADCNACTFVDGEKTGRVKDWCYMNNNQCTTQLRGQEGSTAAFKSDTVDQVIPDGTDAYDYEIAAGVDDVEFRESPSDISDQVQRVVSTLDQSNQKVHIHPVANLAVIKLDEPFEMNSKTATACLPSQNQNLPPDTPCYLAAWGFKRKGTSWTSSNKLSARRLRETDLPMLSDEDCKASGWFNGNNGKIFMNSWRYGTMEPEDVSDFDNQICAGHKDKNGVYDAEHGVAPGDEGAPLICVVNNKPVYMGAAIYTESSLQLPNFPNLFTKVSSQVEWIQQLMET